MLPLIKRYRSEFYSGLVGLYFILLLQIKGTYTAIPLFVAASGLILLIFKLRQGSWTLSSQEKWLIVVFSSYFLLFVLSLLINGGRIRELDMPSKALLLMAVLVVCSQIRLKIHWILSAILLGSFAAGTVALYRSVVKNRFFDELLPAHQSIQAGGITMTLSLFCFAAAFYFYRKKAIPMLVFSLVASLAVILASLLLQARGAWVGAPFILGIILWLNRKLLSKWIIVFLAAVALCGTLFAGNLVKARWELAVSDIQQYLTQNNGHTSVGGRLDMWKSSFIGIQEKPILGRGVEAIPEMRQNHFKQGLISEYASNFQNAHNQYLHDATARGLVGLAALLAVFFVPLWQFWCNLKGSEVGSQAHLWGVLGITHVLATMGYCLTQSFLSHNSGTMFYFFTVFLLLGLQKSAQNRPLAEAG